MTKTKILFTKIIFSILIIFSFLLLQTGVYFSNSPYQALTQQSSVVALSSPNYNYEDLTDSLSNPSFDNYSPSSGTSSDSNYTGNTQIKVPTSWTADGNKDSSIKMGVINIEQDAFKDNYSNYGLKITNSPALSSMKENKNGEIDVLMINSESERIYGYTSSSIDLKANSFYKLSVRFYTGNNLSSSSITDNPTASVVLMGDDFTGLTEAALLGYQSDGNWATATFYIATNQCDSTSVQVGVYLGSPAWNNVSQNASAGYVFFDDVTLIKYSKQDYDNQNKASIPSQYIFSSVIDLTYSNITSGAGFVEGGEFDNLSNWEVNAEGSSTVQVINANTSYNSNVDPSYTNRITSNQNVLIVYNAANRDGSSTGTVASSDILIKRNTSYRISFWAKTNASSMVAEIEATDKINGNTYDAVSITTPSSKSNSLTNDWHEYVFYVTGNSLYDANVQITLGLTSSNNLDAEYIFFDNITSQQISTDDIDSASNTEATTATLSLSASSSSTLANGNFNSVTRSDIDVTYPLEPSDWTYEGITSTSNIHGVINLKSEYFNETKSNFGNPQNKPASSFINSSLDVSNNALMLYNSSLSNQTYSTSSTLTASASTCYLLNLQVFTDIISGNGGVNIVVTNSDDVVIAELLDQNTNGKWQNYQIYINNYSTSQTLTITISFGRENSSVSGWAYFDNISFESFDGELADVTQSGTTKIFDLVSKTNDNSTTMYSDGFDYYSTDYSNADYRLNDPLYFTGEVKAELTNEEDDTTTTLDDTTLNGVVNFDNIDKVLGGNRVCEDINNSFLMIYSPSDTYYAFTNDLTISLEESSYYRVSVKVKTVGLSQNTENQQIIDDEIVPFGASIILSGIDQSFTGINTNGTFEATDDGWEEFVFYINTTDAIDLEIMLGLGSENAWTSGYAFFDDILVEEMDEDNYTLALNLDQEDTTKEDHVISIVNTTTPTDEDDSGSSTNIFSESLAWLSIPTVIIGVGIIVAIAGYCIKKYRENRPVKVKVTSNYDRSSTLLKELDHRNYKVSVKHRLKLLYEELAQTQNYLEEEKAEHKKQMEAFETAKDIAKQDKSIHLENPDKKYMDFEKTVQQLEKNIASIKADIEILEQEQKQLEREEQRIRKDDLKGNKITRRK